MKLRKKSKYDTHVVAIDDDVSSVISYRSTKVSKDIYYTISFVDCGIACS